MTEPTGPTTSAVVPPPRWESWGRALILVAFVVVGLRHIHTNTLYGQDFLLHSSATETLVAHPDQWFPQDFTNRPLLYWIGAGCHWITHGKAAWEVAALVFIACNTLALFLLHDCTRRFIRSPALRLAALAFVAFLPATQVAGIVYAADALCQLPFVLTLWSLLRSLEATATRPRLGYALLAGLALSVGMVTRFTFIALLPAVTLALVLSVRWRRISWREGAVIAALTLVLPAGVAGWIQRLAQEQFAVQPAHHVFDWHGTGEMTWSSLLLVKSTDARIFNAPAYWDSAIIDGTPRYLLLINNSYSYPALLHLGIFTDVLDYANEGEMDDGAVRPEPQKTLARWSVWLGVPFFLATLAAVLWLTVRTMGAVFRPALAPGSGVLLWGVAALGWYLPLFLTLPFLRNAYEWGYWLSRLIIPALWGFGVVLFATLDERGPRHRWFTGSVAVVVVAQAMLHLRALWY